LSKLLVCGLPKTNKKILNRNFLVSVVGCSLFDGGGIFLGLMLFKMKQPLKMKK
jgi:hypothetical protein